MTCFWGSLKFAFVYGEGVVFYEINFQNRATLPKSQVADIHENISSGGRLRCVAKITSFPMRPVRVNNVKWGEVKWERKVLFEYL